MAKAEPDPFESSRMTLGEHLTELRKRLVRGMIALVIAFCLGWAVYPQASHAVQSPMRRALAWLNRDQVDKYEQKLVDNPGEARSLYFLSDDPGDQRLKPELTVQTRMVSTRPGENFAFALKVSTMVAFALGAPVLLWQMWGFIAAGLYTHERRAIFKFFPISLGLFIGGVLFGFFVMVPYTFYFLIATFPPEEVQFLPSLDPYLSLLTSLTLILGAVFQLPVVMYAVTRMGLVERATFVKYRKHFIVGAFLISGILTPPDPYTQSMMAIPMLLMYEAALFWTRFLPKRGAADSGSGARP